MILGCGREKKKELLAEGKDYKVGCRNKEGEDWLVFYDEPFEIPLLVWSKYRNAIKNYKYYSFELNMYNN